MGGEKLILYIVNALECDAPTSLMLECARAALMAGWNARFVALSRAGDLQSSAEALGLRPQVIGLKRPFDQKGYSNLRAVLRDFRSGIVHIGLTRPALLAGPVAAAYGAKVVITQSGVHEWKEGGAGLRWIVPFAFRRSANRAAAVVTVSAANLALLIARGVRAENLLVIPNGVDTEKFAPFTNEKRRSVRQMLFPDANDNELLIVGAAGNLRLVKGYDLLVNAAIRVKEQFPNVRFCLWGDGAEMGRLGVLISSLRLSDIFRILPRQTAMQELFPTCDVFVQPSREEAFGLAAAEAMSCGVPVVATPAGGLPELIEDGKTGMIAAGINADHISQAIIALLSDGERRRQVGNDARRRITGKFSLKRMTDAHLKLYDQVLRGDSIAV